MNMLFLSLSSGEVAVCLTSMEKDGEKGYRGAKRREQLRADNLGGN